MKYLILLLRKESIINDSFRRVYKQILIYSKKKTFPVPDRHIQLQFDELNRLDIKSIIKEEDFIFDKDETEISYKLFDTVKIPITNEKQIFEELKNIISLRSII
jgi:hypothetical protein